MTPAGASSNGESAIWCIWSPHRAAPSAPPTSPPSPRPSRQATRRRASPSPRSCLLRHAAAAMTMDLDGHMAEAHVRQGARMARVPWVGLLSPLSSQARNTWGVVAGSGVARRSRATPKAPLTRRPGPGHWYAEEDGCSCCTKCMTNEPAQSGALDGLGRRGRAGRGLAKARARRGERRTRRRRRRLDLEKPSARQRFGLVKLPMALRGSHRGGRRAGAPGLRASDPDSDPEDLAKIAMSP